MSHLFNGWLGGSVVKALDSGPRGRQFDSRRLRYQVTTLGKLFTPTCLCRCTWSSGWSRLVTFRLRFDSHRRSFASNLEQVANLPCAQINSASYPQRDKKWVVAYGLRGEGLVWLIGAMVSLLAANRGSNCSLTRAMDGRNSALWYHSLMPISCHSRDCKALLVTYSCKKRYNKYRDLYFYLNL